MKLKISLIPTKQEGMIRMLILVVIVAMGLTMQGTSIAWIQKDFKLSLFDTVAIVTENIPAVLMEGREQGRSLGAVTSSPTSIFHKNPSDDSVNRSPTPRLALRHNVTTKHNLTASAKDRSEYTRNVMKLH